MKPCCGCILLSLPVVHTAVGRAAFLSPTATPTRPRHNAVPLCGLSSPLLEVKDRVDLPTIGEPIAVSPIGIGVWAWGDGLYWKYNEKEDPELQETFETCFKAGCNLYDTAEVYGFGRSERLLGQFIRQTPVAEDSVVVASKFGVFPWRWTKKTVVDACRASLDRMGRGSIDLYQLHWPVPWSNEVYWDGLAECVEEGLVKAVGVSNYGEKRLRSVHARLKERGIPLASNQIQLSLVYREPLRNGLVRACEELGVKVIAYSPLAHGLLTGRYEEDGAKFPDGPREKILRDSVDKARPLLEKMREIGKEKGGWTPSQVALAWCTAQGVIPIPGARNVRQAKDNLGAVDLRLSSEEVERLSESAEASGVSMNEGFSLND
uniref:NADP-dependent oxidoreductase domain-containing protein n=1 Tax=Chromera velia CCMP2878 TaxID=1169474 RepID=A0A0G4HL95_9ALVE|eukprot:Cvel_28695.t1-p1 / transcript=Cvel_28695.t1 / gene=Cvel_28695 / organism=Chromera_velia_CCMP2878 / gene_product=Uncharacterized oxidoreductase At1g06690,, putative / transcript_product=Uncharacterized oxidoreductase At1g06690,, putative / location=Cvel_scaffold3807:6235-11035(+) / protein_length=376 / sequence_SO=supercontig / SO=protein_coding / is_pseudo=false